MKRLKTIIIDDDTAPRQTIRSFNEQCNAPLKIVAEYGDATSGLQGILSHRPEVVFLDIEMPDFSGFQLLKSIPDTQFHLIIITGFEKFALQAIKASALDFLLKPFNLLEFQVAIDKIRNQQKSYYKEQHNVLLQNVAAAQIQKILVPTEEGWHVIAINRIIRCEADTVYTRIFLTNNEQILSSKPLKSYEALLPKSAFVRVHKSHLIHLQFIKKYVKGRGGQVEMTTGTLVPVSRQRKTDFIEKLYLFTNSNPV